MRDAEYSFDFEYLGHAFRAFLVPDDSHGRPWEESDGHGPVREVSKGWHGIEKRPGERPLYAGGRRKRPLYAGGRRERSHAYDWQAAMRAALADGWGTSDGRQPGETRRQYAARAVAADFEFLRAWCAGEWHYVGVCVARLDSEGEPLEDPYSFALWGVESCGDYSREVARELAHECLHAAGLLPDQCRARWRAALREARERRYWNARGVVTC